MSFFLPTLVGKIQINAAQTLDFFGNKIHDASVIGNIQE